MNRSIKGWIGNYTGAWGMEVKLQIEPTVIGNARLFNCDCLLGMKGLEDCCIDLTVTSPPYDELRDYHDGNSLFDFEGIAKELYRVTNLGGVVVWIVGDATVNGNETGTSFKQALYFKQIGFNLHDTMIWNKGGFSAVGALKVRYAPVFEYMFVFTKGKLKTFNPIKDHENKSVGRVIIGTVRNPDGSTKPMVGSGSKFVPAQGQRFNVWEQSAEMARNKGSHPAPFPLQLATDHILSWSNEGDTICDPFTGSGTTGRGCIDHNRKFIGFEIDPIYFEIAKKRLEINSKRSMLVF